MGTDLPRSKRHRRVHAGILLLASLVVLVLIATGVGVFTVTRSFPQLAGTLELAGLDAETTVYRDEAGVPQIVADTAGDLFRAQGFVHAQDRFWEMDFRRHVTSGRLAELFGESQLPTDTFIRTLGWRVVAEAEVAQLDPTTLGYYEAYAEGVNAYLDTHRGAELSLEYAVLGLQNPEYEPELWTPADSVAWLKAMAWDLRSNLDDEIDRALLGADLTPEQVAGLHPTYPYDSHPTIVDGTALETAPVATAATTATDAPGPPAEASVATGDTRAVLSNLRARLATLPELLGPAGGEIGSNSWVVSGAHTATGAPLLANDPHLGPALPSVWYQVGLRCRSVTADCPFDVAGYSFAGLPGVVIGHNQRIAWGFTNLGPDVADLYLERVTGDSYEYDGQQKPLTVRQETILVAGGGPVTIDVRATEHGPLVSGLAGTDFERISGATKTELSLQWTALTPGRTASAIFALNSATNFTSFRAAASLFDVPAQNLMYADVDGNIGYQAPGAIPVRRTGDGTVPVPGWTSEYGWTGTIPFDALPQVYNPASGYIVSANNAAVGPDYPYLLTADWDQGYRAEQITGRLQQLVDAGTPMTAAMMSDIQGDNHSAIAAALVPVLQALPVSGDTAAARELFDGWDFELEAGSGAAAYFSVFWRVLLEQLFADLPEGTAMVGGQRSFAVVETLLGQPDSERWVNAAAAATTAVDQRGDAYADLPEAASGPRDLALARALVDAAAEARDLLGSNPERWEWGQIHELELTHASFGTSGIAPLEWLFNRGPYAVAGGSSVVNAVGWDANGGYGEGFDANWVPSMRLVVDLADFDASTWVNLTGASGHAFHPNYVDQAPLWQNQQTRPWRFTRAAVEDGMRNRLTLTPVADAGG
ncbi:penicillin acylase family protein [Cryobacterium melibiosiphilum]|uniref:Penicillin acylase family protein n=1 Tax=Cryobacterium melibiosiphilum TaxID=995039 RepID=A0A3A5MMP0_9MICO|nr:penicillin acylase family protein [Cryobacterium melibiosiphilum]RJT88388.1 penicillin acylase family protein [Cryobacterium melibiosiphilum]